jgi:hypothetical protein
MSHSLLRLVLLFFVRALSLFPRSERLTEKLEVLRNIPQSMETLIQAHLPETRCMK